MRGIVGGVLVLLLAMPGARAQNKLKDTDTPATPAEQYQALIQQYLQAMKVYQEASRNAKTPEEQQKVYAEKYPKGDKLAPKFIELAEKHPKDPVALDALNWVIGDKETRVRVLELLVRDHMQNEKLDRTLTSLGFSSDKQTEAFLRAVLEKSPHKAVQAEACLALAQTINQRAEMVKVVKENPDLAKQIEATLGKDLVEEMKKTDLAQVEAASAKLFTELADKYVAELKANRLINFCETLGLRGGKGGEILLRTLLEKDPRHDVQGMACLSLGQSLKQRADELYATDAKAAEKLRAESEQLLERAAEQYGDVKSLSGTVGASAKTELFDIRTLSVGKPAPEVEGEDQNGKRFKLSDYKGKVVLLDFWSQF